jgi:hypothetical protein
MSRMSKSPILRLTSALLLPFFLRAQTGGNLSGCKGGCESGESCVGNPFSQPVPDSECDGCAGGKYWWPCNFETLCFCGSGDADAPRFPPAPKSGLESNDIDVCSSVLTEVVFDAATGGMAGGGSGGDGSSPYTYQGLCDAIAQYNMHHDEKFANAGDEMQIRAELAAFIAHVAVDTQGFAAVREEMHCAEPITGGDGEVYCKPCREEHYDASTKTCAEGYLASEGSYKEYCDATRQPPQGCACSVDLGVSAAAVPAEAASSSAGLDTTGYVAASDMYFARGAILNSWNYDYYGAGLALFGDGNVLCDEPDLVSANPQIAWGAGIYKWMEKMKFGTTGSTAHKQAVRFNFGGTVEVLYGELECPAGEWTSEDHVTMVRDRVARVCTAGAALGVYLEMDKCDDTAPDCVACEGLKEIFEACQLDGTCPDCSTWPMYVTFVSHSPTVTPVRIEPPEDWDLWHQTQTGASIVGASSWLAVSLVFLGWLLPLTILWHS